MSETAKNLKQYRIALRNCGLINPENILDYIAVGGYEAMGRVLTTMSQDQVIDEIKNPGCEAAAEEDSPQVSNGKLQRIKKTRTNILFAMQTKVTPGLSWTGASWRAILIPF